MTTTDLGQTLVKHRGDATAFPTEEKAYKALCDIGAQPSAYVILGFRQLGSTFKKDWYALCTHTNEWLKMPNTVTQTTMPDLLTIEYNPSRMLRTGIAQHGSDFMQYFAYVLYGMAADVNHGTTQCSAYLKWARGIEALIKETE